MEIKDTDDSYDPNSPSFINSLQNMTDGQGVFVNVNQPCVLSLSGTLVDRLSVTVPLTQGWNLIGFPDDNPIDINTILTPIMNNVVEVKDADGSFNPLYPAFLNQLIHLEGGKAYFIKVNANVNLTFNY
jgi:hypothetical protein